MGPCEEVHVELHLLYLLLLNVYLLVGPCEEVHVELHLLYLLLLNVYRVYGGKSNSFQIKDVTAQRLFTCLKGYQINFSPQAIHLTLPSLKFIGNRCHQVSSMNLHSCPLTLTYWETTFSTWPNPFLWMRVDQSKVCFCLLIIVHNSRDNWSRSNDSSWAADTIPRLLYPGLFCGWSVDLGWLECAINLNCTGIGDVLVVAQNWVQKLVEGKYYKLMVRSLDLFRIVFI